MSREVAYVSVPVAGAGGGGTAVVTPDEILDLSTAAPWTPISGTVTAGSSRVIARRYGKVVSFNVSFIVTGNTTGDWQATANITDTTLLAWVADLPVGANFNAAFTIYAVGSGMFPGGISFDKVSATALQLNVQGGLLPAATSIGLPSYSAATGTNAGGFTFSFVLP